MSMTNWPGKNKFSTFAQLDTLSKGKAMAGKYLKKETTVQKYKPEMQIVHTSTSYEAEYMPSVTAFQKAYADNVFGELKFTVQKNKVPTIAPMSNPLLDYDGCKCEFCIDEIVRKAQAKYDAYVKSVAPGYVMTMDTYKDAPTPHADLPVYDLTDQQVFGGWAPEEMTKENYLVACDRLAKEKNVNWAWSALPRPLKALGKLLNIDPIEWVTDEKWSAGRFHEVLVRQFGATYHHNMESDYSGYRNYVQAYARLWKYKVFFEKRITAYMFLWVYECLPMDMLEAHKDTILPFLKYHGDKGRHLFNDSISLNDVLMVANMPEAMKEIASDLISQGHTGEAMVQLAMNVANLAERWPGLVKLSNGLLAVRVGGHKTDVNLAEFNKNMEVINTALNSGVPDTYCNYLLGLVTYETYQNRINILSGMLDQRRYMERVLKGIQDGGVAFPEQLDKVFYVSISERPSFMALRDPVAFVHKALASSAQPPENERGKYNDKIAQRAPGYAKLKWKDQYTHGLKIGWMFKQVLEYMESKSKEGHTFYIHGRDGEIVYQLARRSGHKINCRFAITSRSLGPTNKDLNQIDVEYANYLKRMFPQQDKKSIHLDSGFSGSVPKWFHKQGWDATSSFVLVGANTANAEKHQLPYKIRPMDGVTPKPDTLASIYMEGINHRLVQPDTWGKLKYNESSGGFWAYIYGVEDSIKAEFPEFYKVKKSVSVRVDQQVAA